MTAVLTREGLEVITHDLNDEERSLVIGITCCVHCGADKGESCRRLVIDSADTPLGPVHSTRLEPAPYVHSVRLGLYRAFLAEQQYQIEDEAAG